MVLTALVLVSAGQSISRASSPTSCGAFCFADSGGTLLLGPPEMPGPESMTTAVCKGGRRVAVEFIGRQKATAADNGRQMAYNFNAQAGTVFRVRQGRVEPDESCFLTSDSTLVAAVPQTIGPPRESVFCSGNNRRHFGALRNRAVVQCWALSAIGSKHDVGLIEFARQGPDALASLVLIGPEATFFEDFPAHSRGVGEDLWRVDDHGEMSPDGFEILFALRSEKSYILGVSWGSTEGETLLLLVAEGGQRFTQCGSGYRYEAPQ